MAWSNDSLGVTVQLTMSYGSLGVTMQLTMIQSQFKWHCLDCLEL